MTPLELVSLLGILYSILYIVDTFLRTNPSTSLRYLLKLRRLGLELSLFQVITASDWCNLGMEVTDWSPVPDQVLHHPLQLRPPDDGGAQPWPHSGLVQSRGCGQCHPSAGLAGAAHTQPLAASQVSVKCRAILKRYLGTARYEKAFKGPRRKVSPELDSWLNSDQF